MGYDYDKMLGDTKSIIEKYNTAKRFKIGKSLMGRDIICMRIGEGRKKILLAGAFHALEYLTAAVLVRFTKDFCRAIEDNKELFERDASLLSKNVSVYIAPMVNPDGVDIAVNGINTSNEFHKKLFENVGKLNFKSVWQANARGVDINHNFDADWDPILSGAAPSKYGGEYPHSEPETRAAADFVRRENFDMLLAFHSQGEEIYYDFKGKMGKRSFEIADKMGKESGYEVCTPEGTAIFGGCKDWFIKEFGREGFTIEIGRGKNPLPMKMLNEVYKPCAKIILCAMEECLR